MLFVVLTIWAAGLHLLCEPSHPLEAELASPSPLFPIALCIHLNFTSHHPELSQQRSIVSLPWPCPVLAICLSASVQERPSLASHCPQVMGFDEGKLRWMFNLAPTPLVLAQAYFSYLTSRYSSPPPTFPSLNPTFIHSQLMKVAHFFSPHLHTAVLHRTHFFPFGPTFIHPSGLSLDIISSGQLFLRTGLGSLSHDFVLVILQCNCWLPQRWGQDAFIPLFPRAGYSVDICGYSGGYLLNGWMTIYSSYLQYCLRWQSLEPQPWSRGGDLPAFTGL